MTIFLHVVSVVILFLSLVAHLDCFWLTSQQAKPIKEEQSAK